MVPLQLSCVLGVDLGSKAFAEHCPEANATGRRATYTHFPAYATESAAAAADLTGTLVPTAHPVCSDCSGYDEYNVSQIHLYPRNRGRSVLGRR